MAQAKPQSLDLGLGPEPELKTTVPSLPSMDKMPDTVRSFYKLINMPDSMKPERYRWALKATVINKGYLDDDKLPIALTINLGVYKSKNEAKKKAEEFSAYSGVAIYQITDFAHMDIIGQDLTLRTIESKSENLSIANGITAARMEKEVEAFKVRVKAMEELDKEYEVMNDPNNIEYFVRLAYLATKAKQEQAEAEETLRKISKRYQQLCSELAQQMHDYPQQEPQWLAVFENQALNKNAPVLVDYAKTIWPIVLGDVKEVKSDGGE